MLRQAGTIPVAPAAIRAQTGAQSTTVYQTLRRLAERGLIRRSTQGGTSGWELVPTGETASRVPEFESNPGAGSQEPTPGREAALKVAQAVIQRQNDQERQPTPEAIVEYMDNNFTEQLTRDDAEWAVWSLCRMGVVTLNANGGLELQ